MTAAACCSLTRCGIGTRRSAGTAAYSAYAPAARPGHAISHFDRVVSAPTSVHHPGAFLPGHKGQWRLVASFTEVNVDKVTLTPPTLRLPHWPSAAGPVTPPVPSLPVRPLFDLDRFHNCLRFYPENKRFGLPRLLFGFSVFSFSFQFSVLSSRSQLTENRPVFQNTENGN